MGFLPQNNLYHYDHNGKVINISTYMDFFNENQRKCNLKLQVYTLEGILLFATNKPMTTSPKWLYVWF